MKYEGLNALCDPIFVLHGGLNGLPIFTYLLRDGECGQNRRHAEPDRRKRNVCPRTYPNFHDVQYRSIT